MKPAISRLPHSRGCFFVTFEYYSYPDDKHVYFSNLFVTKKTLVRKLSFWVNFSDLFVYKP